jgi:general secretion pathway protein F
VEATIPVARGHLVEALRQTRRALGEGRSLAQALGALPGVVPPLVLGMVRAGERGGQLGEALEQVATHLEHEAELVARVRQALAYPLLLLVAGSASVAVIVTVVIPRFATILGDLGQHLPASTRALLALGAFVRTDGWAVLVALLIGAIMAARELAQPAGRARWHGLLLATPVVGRVRLALGSARWCRALGAMLGSGMPILPALRAARDAVGDAALEERLDRVAEAVAQGSPLVAAVTQAGAIAPGACQLLAVGEGSGQLPAMALKAGALAAAEADRGLRQAVTLLEPALVVAFGGIVAFTAAALLQAVYAIRAGGL